MVRSKFREEVQWIVKAKLFATDGKMIEVLNNCKQGEKDVWLNACVKFFKTFCLFPFFRLHM